MSVEPFVLYRGNMLPTGQFNYPYYTPKNKIVVLTGIGVSNNHAATTDGLYLYFGPEGGTATPYYTLSVTPRTAVFWRSMFVLQEDTWVIHYGAENTMLSLSGYMMPIEGDSLPINFYRGAPGTDLTTVYTVPTGKRATFNFMSFMSTSGACLFDVYIDSNRILSTERTNQMGTWKTKHTLEAGQQLKLQSTGVGAAGGYYDLNGYLRSA
jgi:hypothetical protein